MMEGQAMHVVWRTAMSMDGKLATADHDLSFLETIEKEDESVADFPQFVAAIDAILLGAETLRWLLRGGHGWPHGDKPTWLLSHDAMLVNRVGSTAQPLNRRENVQQALDEMEASGARRVWLCGGGNLAGQVLALDRIDEVEVTIAPVALGGGSSLFGAMALPERVFHVADCRRVAGNAVLVRWMRKRQG